MDRLSTRYALLREQPVTKAFVDTQELANNFNEDEAVWHRYQQKRGLRLWRGSSRLFPDEVLDRLDWLEAERKIRIICCIGKGLT